MLHALREGLLPVEVVRMIHDFYVEETMCCIGCNRVVLKMNLDEIVVTHTYFILDDECLCDECAEHVKSNIRAQNTMLGWS